MRFNAKGPRGVQKQWKGLALPLSFPFDFDYHFLRTASALSARIWSQFIILNPWRREEEAYGAAMLFVSLCHELTESLCQNIENMLDKA